MRVAKKNCIRIKRYCREILLSVSDNYILLIIYLFLMCAAGVIAVYITMDGFAEGYPVFSAVDALVILDDGISKYLFMMPLFLLLLSKVLREDNRVQIMLREKSRCYIWYKRVCKIFICTFIFTVAEALIGSFIGALCTDSFFNWYEPRSYYWFYTGGVVLEQPGIGFANVLIAFVIVECGIFFAAGLLFILLHWISERYFIGWCICMGIGVLCSASDRTNVSVIAQKFSVNWSCWDTRGFLLKAFAVFLIINTAIIVMGNIIADRREFLNGQ